MARGRYKQKKEAREQCSNREIIVEFLFTAMKAQTTNIQDISKIRALAAKYLRSGTEDEIQAVIDKFREEELIKERRKPMSTEVDGRK